MAEPAYVEAASSLIKKLRQPPQAHSVYIRTDVGQDGKFNRVLCVSWHPDLKSPPDVPSCYMGYPTEIVPWPREM